MGQSLKKRFLQSRRLTRANVTPTILSQACKSRQVNSLKYLLVELQVSVRKDHWLQLQVRNLTSNSRHLLWCQLPPITKLKLLVSTTTTFKKMSRFLIHSGTENSSNRWCISSNHRNLHPSSKVAGVWSRKMPTVVTKFTKHNSSTAPTRRTILTSL